MQGKRFESAGSLHNFLGSQRLGNISEHTLTAFRLATPKVGVAPGSPVYQVVLTLPGAYCCSNCDSPRSQAPFSKPWYAKKDGWGNFNTYSSFVTGFLLGRPSPQRPTRQGERDGGRGQGAPAFSPSNPHKPHRHRNSKGCRLKNK